LREQMYHGKTISEIDFHAIVPASVLLDRLLCHGPRVSCRRKPASIITGPCLWIPAFAGMTRKRNLTRSDPGLMTNLRQPPVTIKDVAQACGVAPSTVSNALTGKGYVRARTRDQVIAAAARLGYRASSLARGLRLQRTWTVGVLVADIANPFFPDLVRGMEDVLWARHYNLMLCNNDYDKAKEAP